MSDINEIFLTGRLGADPKMQYFESGKVTCSISLGVNKWKKAKETEEVTWINCKSWGKLAEFIGEHIKKGAFVVVKGSLEKDVYKTDAGERVNTYVLISELKAAKKESTN